MVRWTIVIAMASWAGVCAAFLGMRAQRKDSKALLHAQISAELDKQFDSTEMRKARKVFALELLRQKIRLPREDRVLGFFEKVGIYHRLQRIDDEATFSSFSYYVHRYWAAAKPGIDSFRKQENDPNYYSDFETLYYKMLQYDAKRGHCSVTDITLPQSKVDEFLKDEAALNP
jgi:hypothetical protein